MHRARGPRCTANQTRVTSMGWIALILLSFMGVVRSPSKAADVSSSGPTMTIQTIPAQWSVEQNLRFFHSKPFPDRTLSPLFDPSQPRITDFGPRISDFFRFSAFGLRISAPPRAPRPLLTRHRLSLSSIDRERRLRLPSIEANRPDNRSNAPDAKSLQYDNKL